MKRTLLSVGLFICIGVSIAKAQVSEGGLPAATDPAYTAHLISPQSIPQISFQSPDAHSSLMQDSVNYALHNGLLRIGTLINSDIDFKNIGTITTMSDGLKIWQLRISVPNSRALGLYYDEFHLPQGVKYFLTNSTGKQVLGAYTTNNNADDGSFATEKVQGGIINLEMDIASNVDINTIKLHINYIAVFDKSTAYLNQYALESGSNLKTTSVIMPYDSSSPCEVNAACASGFTNQKNATVHIEYLYPVT
ncbi:MAG: hypothetical protein JSS96_15750, partial [Bacteroidetes bacterium]|nr:hypothetical protein [Bacteroidota bacterium]